MQKNIQKGIKNTKTVFIDKKSYEHLFWIKKGKEFYHENKIYDVLDTKYNGDTIELHIVEDKQESKLAKYWDLFHTPPHQKHENKGIKFDFFQKFICPQSPLLISPYMLLSTDKGLVYSVPIQKPNLYVSRIGAILSPPPKFFS